VSSADTASLQRLQKIIAAAGLASRRKAETLITEGRVRVNGQLVTELGAKANPAQDHIRVDGKLLHGPEQPRYYMVNKPKGFVTTVSDPEGRPTVMKFVERVGARLFPVGRLDYQSEGLLLMTNDGALANALTRAAARVEKTYLVKVSGHPAESALEQLRQGIMIERGRPGSGTGRILTEPAAIRLLRDAENPWYEVILTEGRNRQIRKLFEEIGHHVEKIRRVGYGPLVLDIPPGEVRELQPSEVAALERAARPRKKAPEQPRALRKVEEKHLASVTRQRKAGSKGRKPAARRTAGRRTG
jgi:23S rRNA pseudouridine2605 synthase